MRLYTFNPETDFALAIDKSRYTPTKLVAKLRSENRFIQKEMAESGDLFFVPDSEEKFYIKRGADIVPYTGSLQGVESVHPWGWNRAIRDELKRQGVSSSVLLSDEDLCIRRNLSHRRTAGKLIHEMMDVNRRFAEYGELLIGIECHSMEAYAETAEELGEYYIKAPWSSSGRGVFRSNDYAPSYVSNIARGIIKRQGGVIMERVYAGVLDCATEWAIIGGDCSYLGLSVFKRNGSSRYGGNVIGSRETLEELFRMYCGVELREIIEMQREALRRVVVPYYNGPLGLDMMVGKDGGIHPCVELNLRMTMGMIALLHEVK